jgi:hypothetical protein
VNFKLTIHNFFLIFDVLNQFIIFLTLNIMKKGILLCCAMIVITIMTFFKEAHANPGQVTIGAGTNLSQLPYYTYFMGSRCNILYTAAEIAAGTGSSGDITGLAFNVAIRSNITMNGLNIRLQATSATSLTGFTNTGWTTVYSSNYTVPGTGWQEILFTTNFNWDGTSNVMAEICFNNTLYLGSSWVRATNAPGMTWGQYEDNADGCNFATGGAWVNRPNIRLNMNVGPPGGTLHGTVTNYCNSAPVIGATVSCGGKTAITGTGGTYTITGITAGTYTATCTFLPSLLPTSSLVTINSNQTTAQDFCLNSTPIIVTGAVTNVICYGDATGAISSTISGGTPPFTYNWSNGYHTPDLTGLIAGLYTLCVIDANSCQSCETFIVTQPDYPLYINAGANQLVYYGYPPEACATLNWSGEYGGTPPYTIQWNTGQTTQSITVCPTITTVYTVSMTDANKCTFSDDVTVCVIDVHCVNNSNLVEMCKPTPPNGNAQPKTNCVPLNQVPNFLSRGWTLGECGIDRTCEDNKSIIAENTSPAGNKDKNKLEAYPNPFSESATVIFTCPVEGHITVKLIDHIGKESAVLFEGKVEKDVPYSVEFDGNILSQGLYFCVLQHSDGTIKIKKLIYTK